MSTTLCSLVAKNSLRMILVEKKILSQKFLQASILPPYIFTTSYSTLATHYVLFSFLCNESRIGKKEREKNNSRDSIL